MKFPLHAVLSASTGRLMGDIGELYKVASFLVGRPVFTHELTFYGNQMAAALRSAVPALPGEADFEHVDGTNYRDVLSEWEKKLGREMDLPDSLRECLADDRDAASTATEMVGKDRVTVIRNR